MMHIPGAGNNRGPDKSCPSVDDMDFNELFTNGSGGDSASPGRGSGRAKREVRARTTRRAPPLRPLGASPERSRLPFFTVYPSSPRRRSPARF